MDQYYFESAISGRPARVFLDNQHGEPYFDDGREIVMSRVQGAEILRLAERTESLAGALSGFLAIDPSETYCCWCDSEAEPGGTLFHRTEQCPRLVAETLLRELHPQGEEVPDGDS